MLAAIGTTSYNVMLLVHLTAVIVAFAPTFVHPFIAARLKKNGQSTVSLASLTSGNYRKIYGPAAFVAGFVGFGLAGMSEKVYRVRQPWLMVAAVLWMVIVAIMFAVLAPAEAKAAAGDASAEKRLSAATGALHLLLAVALFLMIWKPGL